MSRSPLTTRLAGLGTSVFAEMTALAKRHRRGQPRPGLPRLRRARVRQGGRGRGASRAGHNQYAPMPGLPRCSRRSPTTSSRFYGLAYDPASEVTVHAGATEALCSDSRRAARPRRRGGPLRALLRRLPARPRAGAGRPRASVALAPPDFRLRPGRARGRGRRRARGCWSLNSPHNPTGRVFTRAELEAIAARLPPPRPRSPSPTRSTSTSSSTGRAPAARDAARDARAHGHDLLGRQDLQPHRLEDRLGLRAAPSSRRPLRAVHQFVTFAMATPFQHAMAAALARARRLLRSCTPTTARAATRLCDGLAAVGFGVLEPEGTYFALADIRPLGFDDDVGFCRFLVETRRRRGDPRAAPSRSSAGCATSCASPSARRTRRSTRRCAGWRSWSALALDWLVLAVFALVYLGMILGQLAGARPRPHRHRSARGDRPAGQRADHAGGRVARRRRADARPAVRADGRLRPVPPGRLLHLAHPPPRERAARTGRPAGHRRAIAGALSALLANDIVCLAMTPLLVEGCARRRLNPAAVPAGAGLRGQRRLGRHADRQPAEHAHRPDAALVLRRLPRGRAGAGRARPGGVWGLVCLTVAAAGAARRTSPRLRGGALQSPGRRRRASPWSRCWSWASCSSPCRGNCSPWRPPASS